MRGHVCAETSLELQLKREGVGKEISSTFLTFLPILHVAARFKDFSLHMLLVAAPCRCSNSHRQSRRGKASKMLQDSIKNSIRFILSLKIL